MTGSFESALLRRLEVERLIELARAMLDQPNEEMAAIYLDHAIEALHMATEGSRDLNMSP